MKIVVAGGGVAGCVSAIGMARLGYEVIMVHRSRMFEAYEGLSLRTVESLDRFGCKFTLECIGEPSLRSSRWNGVSREANHEYLTFRPAFDAALLNDAIASGVTLCMGSVVGSLRETENGVVLTYKSDGNTVSIYGDAGIDARGRFTPYTQAYQVGPKSYSLLQKLAIPTDTPPRTSLHSVRDGWVWQASLGNGIGYIQLTCAEAMSHTLSNFEAMQKYLSESNSETWILDGCSAEGHIVRRDSYGKLHHDIVKGRIFQVGDAASSVDPLSGNGVFQALSMATILPYVIHTILVRNESDYGVSATFYKERVRDLFLRYSHKGSEFYQSETTFESSFWNERSQWPSPLTHQILLGIEEKAILKVPFIEKQRVVMTPLHPMGVCYFEGVDIVDTVALLLACESEEQKDEMVTNLSMKDETLNRKFLQWLEENGVI